MPKHLLLFLGLTCLFPLQLNAFSFNNSVAAAFEEEKVNIRVSTETCDEAGVSNSELEDLLREAADQYWNRAPTSSLYMDVGAPIDTAAAFGTDNPCLAGGGCEPNPDMIVDSGIVVVCNDNATVFNTPQILGVTLTNNIEGRRLVGSLVLINNRNGSRFGERDRDEQIAVLAHELGHAIGLGHSPVRDSLMYFTTVPKRRSLGHDDIKGVTFLYPDNFSSSACGTLALNPQTPKGPKNKVEQSPLLLLMGLAVVLMFSLYSFSNTLVKNE